MKEKVDFILEQYQEELREEFNSSNKMKEKAHFILKGLGGFISVLVCAFLKAYHYTQFLETQIWSLLAPLLVLAGVYFIVSLDLFLRFMCVKVPSKSGNLTENLLIMATCGDGLKLMKNEKMREYKRRLDERRLQNEKKGKTLNRSIWILSFSLIISIIYFSFLPLIIPFPNFSETFQGCSS